MKIRMCPLAVLGLTGALLLGSHAHAAGLNFLSDTAAARMSDEDFKAMTVAAYEALDDSNVPSTKTWVNPRSGASGTVKTVQAFEAKSGEHCKLLQHSTKAKKRTHEATSTVCKMKEGWKLVSEDFAKPPAAQ